MSQFVLSSAVVLPAIASDIQEQSMAELEKELAEIEAALDNLQPAVVPLSDNESLWTFNKVYDLAKVGSLTLRTAEAEKVAAKAALNEAFRKLYPFLYAEGGVTEGELLEGVEFEERRYGLSVEHTLFQSGYLRAVYKQAKKRYEAAKARYGKAEADMRMELARNWYDLVAAVITRDLQDELKKLVAADTEVTRQKLDKGLVTEEEWMEVKTRLNQAEFQVLSAVRDEELARFKLVKAAGIDDEAQVERLMEMPVDTALEVTEVRVSLEKALDEATANRLERIIAGLNVEAQKLGLTAARAKDGLKVDLNGFVGRSASYYVTEDPEWNNDWQLLLKVSMSFGPNSVSQSVTHDDTSPKLGQTDRTMTDQYSAKIGLYDNMEKYTRIHRAKADYMQALKEAQEAERDVGSDACQAFFDYRESLIRIRNALERIDLAEQRLSSSSYQHGLNRITLPEVIDTRIKLVDERIAYARAMADHRISLYKLETAMGKLGEFIGQDKAQMVGEDS
jgi:outer membrane protein TolC